MKSQNEVVAKAQRMLFNVRKDAQVGINNLKAFFGFLIAATMMGEGIMEDKKVTAGEVFSGLFNLSSSVPDFFESFPHLKEEFADLDLKETQELKEFIKERLDLENDAVELFIEDTLDFVEHGISYSRKYFFKKAS